jgi:hypothetical protein
MTARIDTEWSYRGVRAVVIENDLVRADVFPEAGAKIYNVVYKPLDYNFLWHHPRVPLEKVALGLPYDDYFSGGWDELFPNDAPGPFGGLNLPDHGELWCRPWDFRVTDDVQGEVTLYLSRMNAVTTTFVEKWITLRDGESIFRFRHRITNHGKDKLEFLWKLHPACVSSEHHRVDVPGKRGEYVAAEWSRLDDANLTFDWPNPTNKRGETADLRFPLPITSGKRDFVYVTELEQGWCAITDTKKEVGFALTFPVEVFPTVWLFMPHGGWRDIQTVILEPCTAYPKDLNVASQQGTIGKLGPGETLECEVNAIVYAGLKGVRAITRDGVVR